MKNSDLALNLRISGDASGFKKAVDASTESLGKMEARAQASQKALQEALRKSEYLKRQAEVSGNSGAFAKDIAAAGREVATVEKALNRQNAALKEARARAADLADAYAESTRLEAAAEATLQRQNAARQRAVGLEEKLAGQVAARQAREAAAAVNRAHGEALAENARRDSDAASIASMRAGLAAGKTAGGANAAARATLGLPDHRAIAAEINALNLAYGRLRSSGTLTVTELAQAKVKLRQRTAELEGQTNGWVGALGQARVAGLSAVAGFAGLAATGASVLRASEQFTAMNAALRYATGNEQAAAKEMEFLRATADRLGLPVLEAGQAFAKLAAAARGTTLEGQGARDIFTGVASAARALSLSSSDTSGALLAISQMMSKGTVSAEELRGQLGERIPGAFALAAKAAGVSEREFNKLLETGQVMSADFLPKFAVELNRAFAGPALNAAESWGANTARLSNEFNTLKDAAGQAVSGGLIPVVKFLREGVGALNELDGPMKHYATGLLAVGGTSLSVGVGIAALSNPLILLAGRLKMVTGAATLLGAAWRLTPWGLAISGAVAVGYALYENAEKEKALAAARLKSAEALGAELARTMEYKDALILTGAEVDKLATKEVKAYADRMKGAADYYHALYAAEVKRNGPDSAEAAKLAGQRDVYVKAMADLKPLLDARLNLEKDHSGALKLTQEELTPQLKAALDAQTKVYQDAAKAVEDAQKKRRDALKAQADFEKQLLAGPEKKPEEKTFADFDAGTAAARQAAVSGDTEGALKGVEALRAQLLAMKEAGAESSLVLSGLAKSVAEIENLALAKGEEKAQADQAKAFNDLLALQNMAKSLEAIKIGVDQDAAEKALHAAQAALQTFADSHPIIQKVIVQAQGQMLLDANLPAQKKAAGGLITGPGSGTSDSILARLSNGEFVMRAAAVRQWGVERLAALNAGRLPAGFPAFSGGGLVTRAVASLPRFAEGGLASAGAGLQPIHIHLPGGPSLSALADPGEARDFSAVLRREAMKRGG